MPSLSDIPVLLTGDDEADLAVVRAILPAPTEVAPGLGGAVAAMRLREFGVLVADVSSVQDALALLRAARRGRPAARGVVLMPADADPSRDGWELVGRSAFALVQHRVDASALGHLIEEARRDFRAERDGHGRGEWSLAEAGAAGTDDALDAEATRWLLAERRLAAALRRTVTRWASGARGEMEDALLRGVGAVAEATREAQGSPDVLIAIAEALAERQRAEGTHEAA